MEPTDNADTREPLEPIVALSEIVQLLDGTCDPNDKDSYVAQALRVARESYDAHRQPIPGI